MTKPTHVISGDCELWFWGDDGVHQLCGLAATQLSAPPGALPMYVCDFCAVRRLRGLALLPRKAHP